MTVTQRPQAKVPKLVTVSSGHNSLISSASSSISDIQSLQNTNQNVTFASPVNSKFSKCLQEHLLTNKHPGRRKYRRYQNRVILMTLYEDEEDTVTVYETTKTPLTRLIEDSKALEYWNEFIKKSEEEQNEIISSATNNKEKNISNNNCQDNQHPITQLSSKIKRFLKIKRNLPLELVKSFEEEIVKFFNVTPFEKFFKEVNKSCERLLTHAIAQFHSLKSLNYEMKKQVLIINLKEDWEPSKYYLYEFIEKLRS